MTQDKGIKPFLVGLEPTVLIITLILRLYVNANIRKYFHIYYTPSKINIWYFKNKLLYLYDTYKDTI